MALSEDGLSFWIRDQDAEGISSLVKMSIANGSILDAIPIEAGSLSHILPIGNGNYFFSNAVGLYLFDEAGTVSAVSGYPSGGQRNETIPLFDGVTYVTTGYNALVFHDGVNVSATYPITFSLLDMAPTPEGILCLGRQNDEQIIVHFSPTMEVLHQFSVSSDDFWAAEISYFNNQVLIIGNDPEMIDANISYYPYEPVIHDIRNIRIQSFLLDGTTSTPQNDIEVTQVTVTESATMNGSANGVYSFSGTECDVKLKNNSTETINQVWLNTYYSVTIIYWPWCLGTFRLEDAVHFENLNLATGQETTVHWQQPGTIGDFVSQNIIEGVAFTMFATCPNNKPDSVSQNNAINGFTVGAISPKSENQLTIFPNPCEHLIEIQGLEGDNSVDIFDIHGRLVMSAALSGGNKINTTPLVSGIYFLKTVHEKWGRFVKI